MGTHIQTLVLPDSLFLQLDAPHSWTQGKAKGARLSLPSPVRGIGVGEQFPTVN